MTTPNNGGAAKVDVLAVMDRAAEKIRFLAEKTGISHPATDLAEARDAVAELVEADREYNAARSALESTPLVGFGYRHLRENLDRASVRRSSALAPFQAGGAE